MSLSKGLRAPRQIPPARGEKVKSSKLLEEDIRGIRMMHADGYSLGYVAKCYAAYKGFKISKQQIHRIVKGQHWDHVKDRFRFVDVPGPAASSEVRFDASGPPNVSLTGNASVTPENKSVENAVST